MEKIKKPKLKVLLNIVLIISCIANWALLVIIILYDIRLIAYHEWILIAIFVGFFVMLATAFFRVKAPLPVKRFISVSTVICMFLGFFASSIAFLKSIGDSREKSGHEAGQAYATIEHALSEIESGFSIHSDLTKDAQATFTDDDKSIKEKFSSLDFQYIGESCVFRESDTYFDLITMKVYFDDDFSKVKIWFQGERQLFGGGIHEGENYYSINKEEGLELKAMIDNKIEEQINSYVVKFEEAKSKMSINDLIESFDNSEKYHHLTYIKNSQTETKWLKDEDHLFFNKFKTIDISEFEETTTNNNLDNVNFNIRLWTEDSKYEWKYYGSLKLFRLEQTCFSLYKGNVNLIADYKVSDSIGEYLISITEETIAQIEG